MNHISIVTLVYKPTFTSLPGSHPQKMAPPWRMGAWLLGLDIAPSRAHRKARHNLVEFVVVFPWGRDWDHLPSGYVIIAIENGHL